MLAYQKYSGGLSTAMFQRRRDDTTPYCDVPPHSLLFMRALLTEKLNDEHYNGVIYIALSKILDNVFAV